MNALAHLDDRYFEWLCRLTEIPRSNNPAKSYRLLTKKLHSTIFTWFVPNDDNRVEDGKELRATFLEEQGGGYMDHFWLQRECTVLEMLLALAHRAELETEDARGRWFWLFIENLGLRMYSDGYIRGNFDAEQDIDRTLDALVNRTYGMDGLGGLFPLRNPHQDQRHVEIWYQMSSYLLEGG